MTQPFLFNLLLPCFLLTKDAFITLTTIGFGDNVAGLEDPKFLPLYGAFVCLWQLFGLGWLSMNVSLTLEVFHKRATFATKKIDKIAKRHVSRL